MDWDAEIDAELDALSNCSTDDLSETVNDDNEESLLVPSEVVTDGTNWMELFLERTQEQLNTAENGLNEADDILQEVDRNVMECSSRLSMLPGEEQREDLQHQSDNMDETKEDIPRKSALCTTDKEEDNCSSSDVEDRSQDLDNIVKCNSIPDSSDRSQHSPNPALKLKIDKRLLELEVSCNDEIVHRIDEIEAKRLASEKRLQELEEEERKILLDLNRQKIFYENERMNKAAIAIQTLWRRYIVRKQYGEILDEKILLLKEERTKTRIRAIEEKRKQDKLKNELLTEKTERSQEIAESIPQQQTLTQNDPDSSYETEQIVLSDTSEGMHVELSSDNSIAMETKFNVSPVQSKNMLQDNVVDSSAKACETAAFLTQDDVEVEASSRVENNSNNEATPQRSKNEADDFDQESSSQLQCPSDNKIPATSNYPSSISEKSEKSNNNNAIIFHQHIEKKPEILQSLREDIAVLEQGVSLKASEVCEAENSSNGTTFGKSDLVELVEPKSQKSELLFNKIDEDLNLLQASVHLAKPVPPLSKRKFSEENHKKAVEKQSSANESVTEHVQEQKMSLIRASMLTTESERPLLQPATTGSNSRVNDFLQKDATVEAEIDVFDDIIDTRNSGAIPAAVYSQSKTSSSLSVDSAAELVSSNKNNESKNTVVIADSNESQSAAAHSISDPQTQINLDEKTLFNEQLVFEESCETFYRSKKEHVSQPTVSLEKFKADSCKTTVKSDDSRVVRLDSPKQKSDSDSYVGTEVTLQTSSLLLPKENVENITSGIHIKDIASGKTSTKDFEEPSSERTPDIVKENTVSASTAVTQESGCEEEREPAETAHETLPVINQVKVSPSSVTERKVTTSICNTAAIPQASPVLLHSSVKKCVDGDTTATLDVKLSASGLSNQTECAVHMCSDTNNKTDAGNKDLPDNLNVLQTNAIPKRSEEKSSFPSATPFPSGKISATIDSSPFTRLSSDTDLLLESPAAVESLSQGESSIGIQPLTTTTKQFEVTSMWKKWRDQAPVWRDEGYCKNTKPHMRRTIRKSSAAKKFPSLSQEEIVQGKWPFYKELSEERLLESLSRVFICGTEKNGRNLLLIQRCVNLTHLTLMNCGLVSLEGLQACPSLRHINVSQNDITVLSCDGMKRLESLVAVNNRLTSIHGLTGCNCLILIDMSHNNITRVNGLEEVPNLSHLRLSRNQLLNVKGLSSVSTLLSLDVSFNNLSSLEGVEKCGLLRCINASNNCFTCIPSKELTNNILLVELDLSGNNISEIYFTCDNDEILFLSALQRVNLARNKISLEDTRCHMLDVMPTLRHLDLSQNLISNFECLLPYVERLSCLEQICLSDNLLSKDQELECFETCRPYSFSLSFSENTILFSPNGVKTAAKLQLILPMLHQDKFLPAENQCDPYYSVLLDQRKEYGELVTTELKEIKNQRGWKVTKNRCSDHSSSDMSLLPPDLFPCHCDYLRKHFDVALKHRRVQETKSALLHQNESSLKEVKQKEGKPKERNGKAEIDGVSASFCAENLSHERGDSTSSGVTREGQHEKLNELFDSKTVRVDGTETSSAASVRLCDINCIESHVVEQDISATNTFLQPEQDQPINDDGVLDFAAVKIQSHWRRYFAEKRFKNAMKRRYQAAITIQSLWRGYVVRKGYNKALLNFSATSDADVEDFEEVDLSQLEFDEDSYDQKWAYKTNFVEAETPYFHSRSHSAGTLRQSGHPSVTPAAHNQNHYVFNREETTNSQSIWQKLSSVSKPPLPPITPTATPSCDMETLSEHSQTSTLDSHRLKHSSREETLTNEWGLHSSSVTQLMLKRARRMKGRRKKEVNAEEKLRRFQDIKQRVTEQPSTARKPTNARNRVEYFKAREIEFEKQEKKPSEDDERRLQYTYEWLHTSANCSQLDPHSSRDRHGSPRSHVSRKAKENPSTKAGFLPAIPQHRSVVNCAPQRDLELLSLSSYNSSSSRSKQLLKDIAGRHGGFDSSGTKR